MRSFRIRALFAESLALLLDRMGSLGIRTLGRKNSLIREGRRKKDAVYYFLEPQNSLFTGVVHPKASIGVCDEPPEGVMDILGGEKKRKMLWHGPEDVQLSQSVWLHLHIFYRKSYSLFSRPPT